MEKGMDPQSNDESLSSPEGEELATKFSLDEDKKRILIILGIVVLVVVLVVVIVSLIRNSGNGTVEPIVENTNTEVSPEDGFDNNRVYVPPPEVDPFPHDKDRDGILDQDEFEAGTSDTEFDTDKDGLSDRLEIEVWKTDPTNPDTDGDGFNDGLEVIRGFNPNGEGDFEPIKKESSVENSTETQTP